jgi:hypothetical protein
VAHWVALAGHALSACRRGLGAGRPGALSQLPSTSSSISWQQRCQQRSKHETLPHVSLSHVVPHLGVRPGAVRIAAQQDAGLGSCQLTLVGQAQGLEANACSAWPWSAGGHGSSHAARHVCAAPPAGPYVQGRLQAAPHHWLVVCCVCVFAVHRLDVCGWFWVHLGSLTPASRWVWWGWGVHWLWEGVRTCIVAFVAQSMR